jgi:hypothetical protein
LGRTQADLQIQKSTPAAHGAALAWLQAGSTPVRSARMHTIAAFATRSLDVLLVTLIFTVLT